MREVDQLRDIMRRLRNPDGGCPWDLEQDFASIAPYTIEEAYEVAAAIEQQDFDGLKSELGDLLLQVVFHSQMAEEQGLFKLEQVAEDISDKMVRRHPHVFAETDVENSTEVLQNWEQIKAEERATRQQGGVLDDVPLNFPAAMRAQKLQKRAARVGFDWPDTAGVFAKLEEEVDELRTELSSELPSRVKSEVESEFDSQVDSQVNTETSANEGTAASIEQARQRLQDELGDVLFSCVNLARHLGLDAEDCLRSANSKFERRFRAVEAEAAAAGLALEELESGQLNAFWARVKIEQK